MLNAIMIHYLSSKKNINKEEINYIFNLDYLPNNLIKDFFNHYEDLLVLNGYGSYDRKSKIDLNMDDRLRNLYIWTLKEPKKNLGIDKVYDLFSICETEKQIKVLIKKCNFTEKEIKELVFLSLNDKYSGLASYLLKNDYKNSFSKEDYKNIMSKALDSGNANIVNILLKKGYDEKINFRHIHDPKSLKYIIKNKNLDENSIIFNFSETLLFKDLFNIIIDSNININKIKYNLEDLYHFKSNKENVKEIYNKMLNKGFDFYNLDINGRHLLTELLDKDYLLSFKNYNLDKLNKKLKKDFFEVICQQDNQITNIKKEELLRIIEKYGVQLNPVKEYDISKIDFHLRDDFLNKIRNTTNNYYFSSVGWNYNLIEKEKVPLDKIKLLKGINLKDSSHVFINEEDEYNILSQMINKGIDLSYISKNGFTILCNNLLYGYSKSTELLLKNGYTKFCDGIENKKELFYSVEKINLKKYLLLKEYNLLEKNNEKIFNLRELQCLDLEYIEQLIEDKVINKKNISYSPDINIDFLEPVVMKLILFTGKINKTDDLFGYNVINFLAECKIDNVETYKKTVEFYINNGAEVDLNTLSDDHKEQVEIIKQCYSEKIAKEENIALKEILTEKSSNIQSISKKRL